MNQLSAVPNPFASVVPFRKSDMIGKREAAVRDAITQGARQAPGSVRAKLYTLQERIAELPEADFPLQHVFAPGQVARTIQLPAGSIILGKIHKHRHLNILSSGHVSVQTEYGGVEDLHGPMTMTSPAGTKRAVYAHTDAVWTTIHLTDSTDLAEIEKELIAETFSDYEEFLVSTAPHSTTFIRDDFLRVLAETGVTAEWVAERSADTSDLVDLPAPFSAHLSVAPSTIQGSGVFTSLPFLPGDVIGPARIASRRTPLGRSVNHSPWPNSEMWQLRNGDLETVALRHIAIGEEITNDYRVAAFNWGAQFSLAAMNETQHLRHLITGEGLHFDTFGELLLAKEAKMATTQSQVQA